MNGQRFSTEKIINKLRQAEVLMAQGQSVIQLSKTLEISEQTDTVGERSTVGDQGDDEWIKFRITSGAKSGAARSCGEWQRAEVSVVN